MTTFTSLKSKLLKVSAQAASKHSMVGMLFHPSQAGKKKKSIIFFQGTSYAETMGFS